MTIKEFGKQLKTANDYTEELYELAGGNFPLELTIVAGQIIDAKYESEWKEGGTEPVEKKNEKGELITDDHGNPIIEYEENYTYKKLSQKQIKIIDQYIEGAME